MAKHKLQQFIDAAKKSDLDTTLDYDYIQNIRASMNTEEKDKEWSRLVKIFRKLEASKPKDGA